MSRMSARKRARFAAGEIDVDEQNPRLLQPSGLSEGVKGMTDNFRHNFRKALEEARFFV